MRHVVACSSRPRTPPITGGGGGHHHRLRNLCIKPLQVYDHVQLDGGWQLIALAAADFSRLDQFKCTPERVAGVPAALVLSFP